MVQGNLLVVDQTLLSSWNFRSGVVCACILLECWVAFVFWRARDYIKQHHGGYQPVVLHTADLDWAAGSGAIASPELVFNSVKV